MRAILTLILFCCFFVVTVSAQTFVRGKVEWCNSKERTGNSITVSLLSHDSVLGTCLADSAGDFFIYSPVSISNPSLALSCVGRTLNVIELAPDTASFPEYREFRYQICGDPSKTIYYIDSDTLITAQRYDNNGVYLFGATVKNKREGDWYSFYKSGNLWSKGSYRKGLRQGYAVTFYENGNKSSEGYYKNDKMVGKWKYWDESGTLVEKDYGGK